MRMLGIVLVAISLVVLALLPTLWSPTGGSAKIVSPDGWAWQNPLPQGNRLLGVWGSSPSDVFAVGSAGNHTFEVYCEDKTTPPVPEPCCWCIYEVDWWEGEEPPTGDPDNRDYHCLHCVEWLPPGHTEMLDMPIGTHVIPDPSFHQEVYFYGGPEPNGYPQAEWEQPTDGYGRPGISRHTIFFGLLQLYGMQGMELWSSDTLINWKTRYDWISPHPCLPPWSVTLQVIPVSGSPGWPWQVGDAWITIGASTIPTTSDTYTAVVATENVTTPLFPGGIECYRVESYSWIDVNGVDDDGDGQTDEDPFNQYDDDSDGLTDEDGGDGVPDPGELTPSSTDWWNNDYGCSIKQDTYPGTIYVGWEQFYMVWYGTDPPFPPWQPTYNLTVDQSDSCCSVEVGAPVGATVAAGTSQTFTDLECESVISVYADDSDPCCVFDSWSDGGAQNHDVYMDSDKSVTATCDWLESDLTVNSCGCCSVQVDWDTNQVIVPAGGTEVIPDISCCTDVMVIAVTTDDCFCDDIALDGVSQGCDPVIFNMDGNDHVVDVRCREYAPVPEPCCWCIYEVDWWWGEDPPSGDPHRRDYHCLHCMEWLPPGHTEVLGDPFTGGNHTIPDPSFHQEVTFFAGPETNGYGVAEWDTIPGIDRDIHMMWYVDSMEYWNSQYDLINWKTSYDVTTPIGPVTYYYGTLAIIPVSGNSGWPYAVGNSWINIDMSHVGPPAASYHLVNATENVTTPLFPGGIECFRVESYSWIDINGDGVPDPVELTPSSTDWWNNDYGCSINKETYPGTMYMGWEHFYMVWYCIDPPFPPWEPTYNLTVDQSASCCSVDVGAPVGATVAAGTNQTFADLECEVVISVNANDSDPCCDFDQWTGNVANASSASTYITMNADETVTAECSEAAHVPWDVNCDGNVNEVDMNLLYDHFGETGDPGWILEDVKEDGKIDVLDMILVGQHWTE